MLLNPPQLSSLKRASIFYRSIASLTRKSIPTAVFPYENSFLPFTFHLSPANHIKVSMAHSQKLISPSFLRWLSSFVAEKRLGPSKPHLYQPTTALYTEKASIIYRKIASLTRRSKSSLSVSSPTKGISFSSNSLSQAQAALLEYLHCTRCLHFVDAEQMSMNSPVFLKKLLKRVENQQEIGQSLARFLLYHPINEFEPFFESLGLKEFDVSHLLPQNSVFLSDNLLLIKNVHVLCDYGFPRHTLGSMYLKEKEIFGYEPGSLGWKLRAYEDLGLTKASVIRVVAISPSLLIGDLNQNFVQLLEELKSLGIGCNWIVGQLSENNLYNWSKMLRVLYFFSEVVLDKEELGGLFERNSDFLLDASGDRAYSLIGVLLKLGCAMNKITNLLLQFPQIQVGDFIDNLRQSLIFLIEIEMEAKEIKGIVHSHLQLLGSCSLKRPNSVLVGLNVGKKRLCEIIKKDPNHLKNWVLGSKLSRLPKCSKDQKLMEKTSLLASLGFIEDSCEMKNALKVFRGKGIELQERFDCFVKAGLNPTDVLHMIKAVPQILNQSSNMIEKKIDFLVNNLGLPIASLLAFPLYLSFSIKRVKLRFLMYEWLKDQGKANSGLALSTILADSDKDFTLRFVNRHPKGPEVWEKLKQAYYL